MNLHQLRFVREAVRQGFNLTEAARALHTSQPGISKSILELEAELGVPLFHRRGKRLISLTEPGKIIASSIDRILFEIENLRRVGQEYAQHESGELRIAATHTQARYALPPVVAKFRQRFPQAHFVLLQGTATQLADWLKSDQADLAIATEESAFSENIVTLPCYRWEHIIIAPKEHPILQAPLSLNALARHPIITYNQAFAGRSNIDQAFKQAGLNPEIVLEGIDADLIKTYVQLGLGLGIIASIAFNPERDQDLVSLPAGHLFGWNTTRIGIRPGVFMRHLAYEFIAMFAPTLQPAVVQKALNNDPNQPPGNFEI